MATLALFVAGILLLAVVLLAMPVEFAVRASLAAPGAPLERSGRFRWAFGLVDVPLRGTKASRKTKVKPKPKAKPPSKARSRFPVSRLLLNPAAWERAGTLLVRLVRTVQWRTLFFHARFGLDDPADTGQLWGAVGSVMFMLPSRLDLALRPVFDGPDLAFQGEAAIRFVPLRVIGVLAVFGLSPTTWRVLWPIWRSR